VYASDMKVYKIALKIYLLNVYVMVEMKCHSLHVFVRNLLHQMISIELCYIRKFPCTDCITKVGVKYKSNAFSFCLHVY
jgi:hypothetical protein